MDSLMLDIYIGQQTLTMTWGSCNLTNAFTPSLAGWAMSKGSLSAAAPSAASFSPHALKTPTERVMREAVSSSTPLLPPPSSQVYVTRTCSTPPSFPPPSWPVAVSGMEKGCPRPGSPKRLIVTKAQSLARGRWPCSNTHTHTQG